MALPEQIRKQSEAVQELYKQMGAPSAEETPAPDEGAENAVAESQLDDLTQQVAADAGTDVGAVAPTAERKESEDVLQQRYKTLQGMYNAEVPRLHQQNRELAARVAQMEQLLSVTQQPNFTAPAAESAAQANVTQADVDEYGESIDVMRRVAKDEFGSMGARLATIENALRQMHTQVVPQVQTIVKQQAMSAEQTFWADLANSVQNWRDINNNPDFQQWLLAKDPMTGLTRQTLLEDAQRNLDSARVASFFQTWQSMTGQANTVASSRSSPASELESQVAPGRSRSTGVPNDQAKRKYTADDIRNFFADVRTGKFKGREQERDRIERDIFAAQREGRIVVTA